MTLEILSALGLDPDDLGWQDLALCAGSDTNLHYDRYEQSNSIARTIDDRCLSCPVMKQCLQEGMENNEWGVWGGIYLVNGKTDVNRNSHKTEEVWNEIRERIS